MRLETHSRAHTTALFVNPDSLRTPYQSGSFANANRLGTWGDESLASTLEGKSLRMSTREIMFKLYQGGSAVRNDAPVNESKFSVLVDADTFEWTTAEPDPYLTKKQNKLAIPLYAAFEAEPLEDGMYHPAEQIIGEALQSTESERVLDCLRELSLDASDPGLSADVLRCLARQEHPGCASWRTELVRDGLATGSTEIRDAAVQAVEWWGDRDLRDVLKSHNEPVPWLRDYIREVIEDLGE